MTTKAAADVGDGDASDCSRSQRFYAHKAVRDLLWVFTSPHLVAAEHFPVLPTRLAGVDAVQHDPRVIAWLDALETDPSHLVAFLQTTTRSRGKLLALGVYFAALLEYWLRYCPLYCVDRFARSKQIVSVTGQTLGQLKFLLRLARASNAPASPVASDVSSTTDANAASLDLHIEASVKFFLLHASPLEQAADSDQHFALEQFVGPHLGETLAWRVHEVARKLAMCRGASVQHWLRTHYSSAVTSHIVLRGVLFYPLAFFACTADVTQRHDWAFDVNPAARQSIDTDADADADTEPLPCVAYIASDHLRGWWTADVATELRAKVRANDCAALGESRFVVLPKLHWLASLLAREIENGGDGAFVVVDGDAALGLTPLQLLPLDVLVATVAAHFVTAVDSAGAVPLLVAELVRCRPCDAAYGAQTPRWRELSRGFVLDPRCADLQPQRHETATEHAFAGRDDSAAAAHDGVIKPTGDELASPHSERVFTDPDAVTPTQLCVQLCVLLESGSRTFTHVDLKASVSDVLTHQRSGDSGGSGVMATMPAFVHQCITHLLGLDVDASPAAVKAAQRVGHLVLDAFVFATQQQCNESSSHNVDARAWQQLFLTVAHDAAQWRFLFLVLRAVDVVGARSDSRLDNSDSDIDNNDAALRAIVRDLLAQRTARLNAVVVETLTVFWLRCDGADAMSDLDTVELTRTAMAALVAQADWTNAERLAIASCDDALQQQLCAELAQHNELKALKRLRKALLASDQHSKRASSSDALLDSHSSTVVGSGPSGPPIDHARNRERTAASAIAPMTWELIDSPRQLDRVLELLAVHERRVTAASSSSDVDVLAHMVIGIDCEWRPQSFGRSDRDDAVHGAIADDCNGLSLYQLAVGAHVFVVDVQALGAVAAAPLQFVWSDAANALALVGFCVTSDLKRMDQSFPGLLTTPNSNNSHDGRDASHAKLLVELKQLALHRHVPAANWGLAKLARVCLVLDVDKEQQCSDWSARPLSARQLVYAATDAFAVRELALHLLVDKPSASPAHTLAHLQRFAVVTCVASPSFGHWVAPTSSLAPLGRDDVRRALAQHQLIDVTMFRMIARIDGSWDGCARTDDGVVVKTIAVLVRASRTNNSSCRQTRFAAVVVALDRSIDMHALGRVFDVAANELVLADKQTLIQVFGYARGSVGPLGLREQEHIQVVVDECLLSEMHLLCGAGAVDEVYAIAPAALVDTVRAVVAPISHGPAV